eukprot:6200615-Pleurochrysis_carterae.AAC.1
MCAEIAQPRHGIVPCHTYCIRVKPSNEKREAGSYMALRFVPFIQCVMDELRDVRGAPNRCHDIVDLSCYCAFCAAPQQEQPSGLGLRGLVAAGVALTCGQSALGVRFEHDAVCVTGVRH